MNYPFYCPNCGRKENISMRISEYTSSGHHCTDCNAELLREPSSLVCQCSIDNTNTFYRKVN